MKINDLLTPFNPWQHVDSAESAFKHLPAFHRPVFDSIFFSLKNVPQLSL